MAGRKQHFIPRHFLKTFVIPDGNDKLWLYRRGLPKPVPVARDDAAATRDFYSKPTNENIPTLDDLITDYEDNLDFLVDDIRSLNTDVPIPSETISEVVAHLTMRTAYLREFVETGARGLMSSIDAALQRPAEILGDITIQKHKVPEKFEMMVIELFEEHQLSLLTNVSPRAVSRLLYHAMRENFDSLMENVSGDFSIWLDGFGKELSMLGSNAHTKMLKDEIVPEKRRSQLDKFQWKIVNCPRSSIILPDCVAIAEDEDGWGPYILSDSKTTKRVVMPISSNRLAVGSLALDWDEAVVSYKQNAIESCFTFFLSDHLLENSDVHLRKLGGQPRSKISDMTSSVVHEAIEEIVADSARSPDDTAVSKTWKDIKLDEGQSYAVSFREIADETVAKKIAAVVQKVVVDFSSHFPTRGLDGITFAYDYASALHDLDRGKGVRRIVDESVGQNPNGVCMPLAVRRDDGVKTHIVLRGYFADDLLSDDEDYYKDAVLVLCYSLGTVAYNSLVEAKFPGTLLSPYTDPFEGWLAPYNEGLLPSYFSLWILGSKPEFLRLYSEQAFEQLNNLVTITQSAQTEYILNDDYERYFEVSAKCVSSFLSALVRLFAVRANLIGPSKPNTSLDERLMQLDLFKWASLFEKDMFAFINGLENWKNFEEAYFINRHFERLLMEIGVLPDQLDDGSLYIRADHGHHLASKAGAFQSS